RKILRINPGAKIDSSRSKNIRAPAGIAADVDTDYAALGASFLSKICDLDKAIFRNGDRERRSCNDLSLESAGRNKASVQQKKQANQPPVEIFFYRHIPPPPHGQIRFDLRYVNGRDPSTIWRCTYHELGKSPLNWS